VLFIPNPSIPEHKPGSFVDGDPNEPKPRDPEKQRPVLAPSQKFCEHNLRKPIEHNPRYTEERSLRSAPREGLASIGISTSGLSGLFLIQAHIYGPWLLPPAGSHENRTSRIFRDFHYVDFQPFLLALSSNVCGAC
jgi:hypothetical protein